MARALRLSVCVWAEMSGASGGLAPFLPNQSSGGNWYIQ